MTPISTRPVSPRLILLVVASFLSWATFPAAVIAQVWHDSDNPHGMEFVGERTMSGNPLGEGDIVYGLRFAHRFARGDLGLELGLLHAEPTSDFVRSLGPDSELTLLELSVAWYPGYHGWYEKALARDPWHDDRGFKIEPIVFGGPGWGVLRIDDAFPSFPLSDASRDYLVIHGGVGAKIHWFRTDPNRRWYHKTSRWYLRPEVRARWFAGEDGEVDWTVGLTVGVGFGRRPSCRAAELASREAMKSSRDLVKKIRDHSRRQIGTEEATALSREARAYREQLEELRAHSASCRRARFVQIREDLDRAVDDLVDAETKVENGVD